MSWKAATVNKQYKQSVAMGAAKKLHGYKSSDDTSQNFISDKYHEKVIWSLTQRDKNFLSYAHWM